MYKGNIWHGSVLVHMDAHKEGRCSEFWYSDQVKQNLQSYVATPHHSQGVMKATCNELSKR